MVIKKIVQGYVEQVFDTNTGKFVSQKFVAGDDTEYEDEDGKSVNPTDLNYPEPYLPFDMVQPEN